MPPVGEGGGHRAGGRLAAALDQRPVGAAGARDVDRRHAGPGQQAHVLVVEPEPDLLDQHRQRRQALDGGGDPRQHAGEVGLALGLHGLLDRVEVDREAIGLQQADEPGGALGPLRPPQLCGAEVGQQQRRPEAALGTVGAQRGGVVEQPAPRAEHEGDPVLGGRARQPAVDLAALLGPAGHRRDDERGLQGGAQQPRPQPYVGERTLGQRAVAQAHALEAGTPRVLDARPGRDADVIGLAGGSRGVVRGRRRGRVRSAHSERIRTPRRDGRTRQPAERLANANPRSSSFRAWSPGLTECSSTTPRRTRPRRALATRQRPAASVKPVFTPVVPG